MDKYEQKMTPIDKLKRHRSVLKLQTHLHDKIKKMTNNLRRKQSGRWFKNLFSRKNSKKINLKEKGKSNKKIKVDDSLTEMRKAQRKRFTQMDLTFAGSRQFASGVQRLRRANTNKKKRNDFDWMPKRKIKLRDISDYYLTQKYFEPLKQNEEEEHNPYEDSIIKREQDIEQELIEYLVRADRVAASKEMKEEFLRVLNRLGKKKSQRDLEEEKRYSSFGFTDVYINVLEDEIGRMVDEQERRTNRLMSIGGKSNLRGIKKKKTKSRFKEDNNMEFEDLKLSIFSQSGIDQSSIRSSLRDSQLSKNNKNQKQNDFVLQVNGVEEFSTARLNMKKKGKNTERVYENQKDKSESHSSHKSESKSSSESENNSESSLSQGQKSKNKKSNKKVFIDLENNELLGTDYNIENKAKVYQYNGDKSKKKNQIDLNLKEKLFTDEKDQTLHIDSMNKVFKRRETVDNFFIDTSEMNKSPRSVNKQKTFSKIKKLDNQKNLSQIERIEENNEEIETQENPNQIDNSSKNSDLLDINRESERVQIYTDTSSMMKTEASHISKNHNSKYSNSNISNSENSETENQYNSYYQNSETQDSDLTSEASHSINQKWSQKKPEKSRFAEEKNKIVTISDLTEEQIISQYNSQVNLVSKSKLKWEEENKNVERTNRVSGLRHSKSMSHLKELENVPLKLDWQNQNDDNQENIKYFDEENFFIKIEGGIVDQENKKNEELATPIVDIEKEIMGLSDSNSPTQNNKNDSQNENILVIKQAPKRLKTFDELRLSNTIVKPKEENQKIEKMRSTFDELRLSSSFNPPSKFPKIEASEPNEFEFTQLGVTEFLKGGPKNKNQESSEFKNKSNNLREISSHKKSSKKKKVIGTKKQLEKIEFMIGDQKFGLETKEIVESPLLSIEFLIGDQKIKLGEKSWSEISLKYQDIRPKIEEIKRKDIINEIDVLRELDEIINGVGDLSGNLEHQQEMKIEDRTRFRDELSEKVKSTPNESSLMIGQRRFFENPEAVKKVSRYRFGEESKLKEKSSKNEYSGYVGDSLDVYSDVRPMKIDSRMIGLSNDHKSESQITKSRNKLEIVEEIDLVENEDGNIEKNNTIQEIENNEIEKDNEFNTNNQNGIKKRKGNGVNKKNTKENIILRIKARGADKIKKKEIKDLQTMTPESIPNEKKKRKKLKKEDILMRIKRKKKKEKKEKEDFISPGTLLKNFKKFMSPGKKHKKKEEKIISESPIMLVNTQKRREKKKRLKSLREEIKKRRADKKED